MTQAAFVNSYRTQNLTVSLHHQGANGADGCMFNASVMLADDVVPVTPDDHAVAPDVVVVGRPVTDIEEMLITAG